MGTGSSVRELKIEIAARVETRLNSSAKGDIATHRSDDSFVFSDIDSFVVQ